MKRKAQSGAVQTGTGQKLEAQGVVVEVLLVTFSIFKGSRVGMRPFLALSTASVIPAAFHPFKMIFLPFSPCRNSYILISSLAWIGFSVESFRSTSIVVHIFLTDAFVGRSKGCNRWVRFFGTATTFMFSLTSSLKTLWMNEWMKSLFKNTAKISV